MMELLKWAQGNPGALVCLMGLLKYEDLVAQITIILKIKKLEIFGTDLYVLWSDISNKDYALMAYLCKNVPENVLKDASSRQDYSGIELCKPYILQFYTDKTVEKFWVMLPTIIVKRDFDGFFERQVKAAIEMNERSGVPMVSTINLSSGPYRPYDMKFVKASDSCDLDFYSASRVFGGDYTIKDIAECIAKKV